ncbi:hypothetical protein CPC735_032240 [Coccidioides posadasii C735 delta SOWgp]|uniref:Uncharacterized protein n=1 Tax=Coccidioides posadasii (strain C735) TaxID=222929 RepID=C5P598_COCP7|nr:hypothetical protein CPC735_032240 [Coccidioides posadasii C735 delta SOWgp]EER27888.1 hypothetical protein CPC735_032240 [Coccidioides posadasii C735 delta SOWgp]|eukprot:XP_003070033.1 hypothetical protein CPC735_032240 [Coccidioides posadasii C735 delta SOWgp]
MVDLTVGHVSGIIAAGVYVLQFLIPTATTLILAGLVTDKNSLATWTQIGRSLHASHWPLLLRADTATAREVSRAVRLEGILRPLILLIVGIAAVVTPLGLYDAVVPGTKMVPQPFQYQPDTSPFGSGTPPRSKLGFNRICGAFEPRACPGSKTVIKTTRNGTRATFEWDLYDIDIPANLTEMFQSGLERMKPTVSSMFDIQWRSYSVTIDDTKNNGSAFLGGSYKQMDTLVLKDGYIVVEGLIVDNKNGGIGFRNHTTPSPLKYGGTWSEDLLFIEPFTQCVDTNITVDFVIPDSNVNLTMQNVKITDRGGFEKLNTTYPQYDRSDPQANPDLYGRAYKAAYLHNAYTMLLLNVTNPRTPTMRPWSYLNSTEGKTFPIDVLTGEVQPTQLGTYSDWRLWDGVPYSPGENASSFLSDIDYPNPYNISQEDFRSIRTICQGAGSGDIANITNIGVACGLFVGAARRVDGGSSLVTEPRTEWTTPLYSCASSARAVVKTVNFRYNGTDGLNSLSVLDIRDKIYNQESDKPLWGVERLQLKLGEAAAMWGLVSDRYKGRDDVSVIQSENLWLPGFVGSKRMPSTDYMNLPGVSFHMDAFASIYTMQDRPSNSLLADYSGRSNLALYARWQELSKDAKSSSTIINQIWTDIAANAVVGTRSWVREENDRNVQKRSTDQPPQEGDTVNVPVDIYHHTVRYHIAYGVPAFIALALASAIAASSCILCVFGRARPSAVKRHLYHTGAGRILGSFMYPGVADRQAPTKAWNAAIGSKMASMATPVPHPLDNATAHYSNGSRTNLESPLLHNKEGLSPAAQHQPQS